MIGLITDKKEQKSSYHPSKDIFDLTKMVQKDYAEGVRILETPWLELNDRSVIDDANRGQMMFNAFVDTSSEDPNEDWKWKGTRSMARNKAIAMHANLTANYLLPLFTAQNENDEVDKGFSEVMRYIIEWMAEPTNSNYQSSFLQLVFSMMQNPVTYLGAEYCEVYQTIREKTESGKYQIKEVLDEVLSGFQAPVWSANQLLITNAYERNIQKQRVIIERRWVELDELEAKYGEYENFKFVTPGQRSVYSADDDLFYDVKDDEHPNLVAEETWKSRRKDLEICFLGGVCMVEGDIGNYPIKHRDNRGVPKYNKIPFGFYRIGDHFFFYKSVMNALGWDDMLTDAVYEMGMNEQILRSQMPIATFGSDKVDSEVIFPNAVVSFEDKDAKIQPLLPPQNNSILSTLPLIEESMSDATVSETTAGQLPEASQKAYSVAQANANAKILLKGVGKSLAESIIMYGDLMKDIAINHYTTAQVDELMGGSMKLKYRQFFLENKSSGGNKTGKNIVFDESMIGMEMTQEEQKYEGLRRLDAYSKKTGKKIDEMKESVYWVNPELFAKFKYLTKCDVEEMFAKNQEYWQPVLMELKAQLAQDPYVNQEELTKRLMYAFFQSDGDDLIAKQPMIPGGMSPPQQGRGSQFGQQVQQKQLNNAVINAI